MDGLCPRMRLESAYCKKVNVRRLKSLLWECGTVGLRECELLRPRPVKCQL